MKLPAAALLAITLAACSPDGGPPPTPTKTPAPPQTAVPTLPPPTFPSLDALAAATLNTNDVQARFEPDPAFTGPLTTDILVQASSPETGAFLMDIENLYGYRSGLIRADSVDDFTAIRNWFIVFSDAVQASTFLASHPTIIAQEDDFQSVPFVALGDESAAYRATASDSGAVLLERHDIVMRRSNVAVVLTVVTASGQADLNEIQRYATLLDMRLGQLEQDS